MVMGLWRAAPWRARAPACPDLGGLGMVEEVRGWGRMWGPICSNLVISRSPRTCLRGTISSQDEPHGCTRVVLTAGHGPHAGRDAPTETTEPPEAEGSHCSWVWGLGKSFWHELFNKEHCHQSHCLASSAWNGSKPECAGMGGCFSSSREEQNAKRVLSSSPL